MKTIAVVKTRGKKVQESSVFNFAIPVLHQISSASTAELTKCLLIGSFRWIENLGVNTEMQADPGGFS